MQQRILDTRDVEDVALAHPSEEGFAASASFGNASAIKESIIIDHSWPWRSRRRHLSEASHVASSRRRQWSRCLLHLSVRTPKSKAWLCSSPRKRICACRSCLCAANAGTAACCAASPNSHAQSSSDHDPASKHSVRHGAACDNSSSVIWLKIVGLTFIAVSPCGHLLQRHTATQARKA